MRVTVAAPYHVNAGTGAVAAGDGVTSVMNPVARADWDACALLSASLGLVLFVDPHMRVPGLPEAKGPRMDRQLSWLEKRRRYPFSRRQSRRGKLGARVLTTQSVLSPARRC